jgi:autotransporter-associated beta strand protein
MPALPTRAALLASTALATVLLIATPVASLADNWLAAPADGNFSNGANWDTGLPPNFSSAIYGTSAITNVSIGFVQIADITVNAGAYTFTFFDDFANPTLNGAGIIVNGGSATVINNSSPGIYFLGNSTIVGATVINNAAIVFADSSSAGNAAITNAGFLLFFTNSTAGNATLVNTGTVDFSGSAGPAGDGKLSAGSIAGAGSYVLGGNQLTVGGNNNSTEVSGVISGAGGSLVKSGTGTLTLTGANTYTGGTTISGGTLQIGNGGTSGSITGDVTNNAALIFNRSDALTFGGAISGSGTMEKKGGDVVTLTGANSYTGATTISAGTLQIGNGGTTGSITGNISNDAALIFNRSDALTYGGVISGSGTVEKTGAGTLTLTGANSYTGATTVSGGTLQLGTSGSAASTLGQIGVGGAGTLDVIKASIAGITNAGNVRFRDVSNAGQTVIANTGTVTFADASNAGSASINNAVGATLTFRTGSSAGNAIIDNLGTLSFIEGSSGANATVTNRGTMGFSSGTSALNASISNTAGASLTFSQGASAGNASISNAAGANLTFAQLGSAGGASITNAGTIAFIDNATGGNAAFTNLAGGLVDFKDSTGPANDGRLSAGSIAGAGEYLFSFAELTVGGNNRSTEASGELSGLGGALVKTGSGTLTLSGTSSYTGATTVDAGTLAVNGSIAASSGVTVSTGATLGGTGQLPGVIVNAGGTLAPGNSIGTVKVNGNLQFGAGSFYTVEVSPTSADRTNVTGTANLTGTTVQAVALPGSFTGRTYTIVNATGGLGGTQFAGLTTTGSFDPARNAHLAYDLNNAYLVLDPGTLTLPQGASRNQSNVAGSINRAVNSGTTPPAGFDTLLNISAGAAGRALDQLSGASSTQAQSGGFQLGNSFLALISAPPGAQGGAGRPLGYASEQPATPRRLSDAFAALDTPTAADRRWSVWGTGFGAGNRLSGDAATGSPDSSARAGAIAAGADYLITPTTLAGFSLAGGTMSWSADNGGGSSDLLLAGIYGKHEIGATYLTAAASTANYWMSTTRTVTVAGLDQLTARFNAQSFGGRVEAGHRLPVPFLGASWTPYGALQAQSFRTPAYAETVAVGSNQFALSYAGRTATAFRAELGVQTERRIAIDKGGQLTLFGRTSYAHDTVSNPALAASFTALGTAGGFTVFGTRPSQNLLLTSSGAEWQLAGGVSVMLKAESEWGERSRSWSGTGRFRYAW